MGRTHVRSTETFSATGESLMTAVSAFRTSTYTIITTGFSGSITLYASNSNITDYPDLTVAASDTNLYSVVRAIDLQDGTPIADGLITIAGPETAQKRYEINDNNNNFVGVKVVVTAGSVIVKLNSTDNL